MAPKKRTNRDDREEVEVAATEAEGLGENLAPMEENADHATTGTPVAKKQKILAAKGQKASATKALSSRQHDTRNLDVLLPDPGNLVAPLRDPGNLDAPYLILLQLMLPLIPGSRIPNPGIPRTLCGR